MGDTKTPWTFGFQKGWPFDPEIKDTDGAVVLSEPRYAHSSDDRTPDDVLRCVNFKHSERATAAAGNAAQVAKFEAIVHAVNSLASHEARIAKLEGALQYARNLIGPDEIIDAALHTEGE